jgi:hypothetical protein
MTRGDFVAIVGLVAMPVIPLAAICLWAVDRMRRPWS